MNIAPQSSVTQIGSPAPAAPVTPPAGAPGQAPAAKPGSVDHPAIVAAPWTNPAATAALRSSVQILKSIEDGIVKHYAEVDKVRIFAADLRTTSDIFQAANEALTGDSNKDNDQFLPLIGQAGSRVMVAEGRLSSKELAAIWPFERSNILEAIKHARVISSNVADQLDPTGPTPR
jgi:hypothetical protein